MRAESTGSGGRDDDLGEVDRGCAIVIKMRGLPYLTTEAEISIFFSGLQIASNGVNIGRDASGRASGEALVEFVTDQARMRIGACPCPWTYDT